MAERINERLALIATSKVQKMEMGDEQDGRPFTPTDHALTERPRLANMNLFPHEIDKAMESLTTVDMSYQTKLKRSNLFKSTFPNHYVDYIEAEPETMQFDQSLATDKVKQEKIAKEFITRNRHRMWMFDVNYVKKGHGTVLKKMLECEVSVCLCVWGGGGRQRTRGCSRNSTPHLLTPEQNFPPSPSPPLLAPLPPPELPGSNGRADHERKEIRPRSRLSVRHRLPNYA